ncbi:hypothetical protein B0919_24140 [Hymenobacter sp. CRA2]|nr:hypothetical protein B0919_24140 [Hymenobacter sp. CRA2]
MLDQDLLDFIHTKLDLYNKLSENIANAQLKRLWFGSCWPPAGQRPEPPHADAAIIAITSAQCTIHALNKWIGAAPRPYL